MTLAIFCKHILEYDRKYVRSGSYVATVAGLSTGPFV